MLSAPPVILISCLVPEPRRLTVPCFTNTPVLFFPSILIAYSFNLNVFPDVLSKNIPVFLVPDKSIFITEALVFAGKSVTLLSPKSLSNATPPSKFIHCLNTTPVESVPEIFKGLLNNISAEL